MHTSDDHHEAHAGHDEHAGRESHAGHADHAGHDAHAEHADHSRAGMDMHAGHERVLPSARLYNLPERGFAGAAKRRASAGREHSLSHSPIPCRKMCIVRRADTLP